jgi:hypothetical protein
MSSSSSSSAHHSPLLDISLSNFSPSRSIFGYSHPAPASRLRKSSLYLAWGHPTLCLPRRGLLSRTRLPQRYPVLRLNWSAHCHFSVLIRCAMSVTLVLWWITSFQIWSRRETSTFNLWISPAMSPYVTTGRTHWLKTFVFRLCGIDNEKTRRSFQNVA